MFPIKKEMDLLNFIEILSGLKMYRYKQYDGNKNKLNAFMRRYVIKVKDNEPVKRNSLIDLMTEQEEPMLFNEHISNDILEEEFKKQIEAENNLHCVLSWLYTLFILISILSLPVLSYYLEEEQNINEKIANITFALIPSAQYIFGILYHSTNHFEHFYNEDLLSRKNLSICCIIFTTVVLFCGIIFTVFEYNYTKLHKLNIIFQILIYILLFIIYFYSGLSISLNIIKFICVFVKHTIIINNFTKALSHFSTINEITMQVMKIKYELEFSIDMFEKYFSAITLLGAISLGIFLECLISTNCDSYPWISFSLYLLLQSIFFILITTLESKRGNLSRFIKSEKFIKNFLVRKTNYEYKYVYNCDTNLVSINMIDENSKILDWILLYNIFSEKWNDFSVWGVRISDGTLIKRGVAIVGFILLFNSYMTNVNRIEQL